MSKVSVFDHGWIDLVFEGRNQSYGAYQLRKQDPRTTMLALFTGISAVVLLISIPLIINRFRQPEGEIISCPMGDITPVDLPAILKMPETPKPEPIVKEPAAPAAQSSEPTVAFKPLEATSQPATTTLTTEEVTTKLPGATTTEGNGQTISITPGTGTNPDGVGKSPDISGPGGIETTATVDVAPLYPGGLDQFRKDVGSRFRTPVVENVSTLKVYVYFVVETDGTLTSVKAASDPGHGMAAEAVRVLKSLKAKWKPGQKGGKAVRTAYTLPIIVRVN